MKMEVSLIILAGSCLSCLSGLSAQIRTGLNMSPIWKVWKVLKVLIDKEIGPYIDKL